MEDALSGVNVTALRQALRLVHCLQKERGASCSCHASKSLFQKRQTVLPARRDTDRALQKAFMCMNSHNARVILEKIRRATESQDVSYHRILATYNCLISAIVHDGILKHTSSKISGEDDSTTKSGNAISRRRRIPSDHDVMEINAPASRNAAHHRRFQSENLRERLPSDPTDFASIYAEAGLSIPPVHSHQNKKKLLPRIDSVGSEPLEEPESVESNPQSSADISESQDDLEPTKHHLARLLRLLETFVALTESIGVERATLCSILAAGPDSHHLLTDLVLEVENQRRLALKLLKCKVGSLCHSVQDLVLLSPQMQDLQDRLLSGNTDGMEKDFDSDQLWTMLTVYINKLHSFELLILEEIEYALEASPLENEQEGVHWSAIFGKYDRLEKLKDIVQSTPPDDVKGKVLVALRQEIDQHFQLPETDLVSGTATANQKTTDNEDETKDDNRLDVMLKELSSAPQSKEWEIDLYQIRFRKRIGQGAAGTTYLADWGGTRVAVKVASISEMGLDGWRTEVQALQRLHHPNIIRLMGSVYHPNPLTFCLVLEYCDAGDLDTAMQRVTPRNFVPHVSMSIAKGMAYLHRRGIIHRDIKPLNVLLNGNVSSGFFDVKVTDFGVATECGTGGLRTAETGTYRWMAPEVIRHEAYSQTADVFSFGIVLWQLITHELPYENKSTFEAAAAVAMESLRPPFPDGVPADYRKLVEDCWHDNPANRPAFEEVVDVLLDMEKNYTEEEKLWFVAPLGHAAYRRSSIPKSKDAAPKLVPPEVQQGQHDLKHKKAKGQKPFLKGLFARKSSNF